MEDLLKLHEFKIKNTLIQEDPSNLSQETPQEWSYSDKQSLIEAVASTDFETSPDWEQISQKVF